MRVVGCDRDDAIGRRLARRLAAPGALGAHHSRFEIRRIFGTAGDVRDAVGGGRGGAGQFEIAAALLAVRMLMALESGWFVMRSPDVLRLWWAIPLRDLFAAAVWLAALSGNSVIWRGRKLKLDREGRIIG